MRRLSAFELLVIHLVQNKIKGSVLDQSFWYQIYSTDPLIILNDLIEDGIIIESNDLHIGLAKLKIPDLKEILKKGNQKVSGNKKELINRIIENNISLNDVYIPTVYIISKEYEQIYYNTGFITDFIYSDSVTLNEACKYYYMHPDLSELEIKTGILISKFKELKSNNDSEKKYKLRNIASDIARTYFDNKQFEQGFYYLNISTLYNIHQSLESYFRYSEYNNDAPYFYFSEHELIKYRSAIYNNNFTLEQLRNDLFQISNDLSLNEKNKVLAIDLLIAKIQDDTIDLKSYVSKKDVIKNNQRSNENEIVVKKINTNNKNEKKKKRFWIF